MCSLAGALVALPRTITETSSVLRSRSSAFASVLDHTIQGIGQVTHVYAKYDFLEEKREALDLWGRYLATLSWRRGRAACSAPRTLD